MSNRKDILAELKKYFAVKELVCEHTHKKLGEGSWQVFPTFALENLLILRKDILKSPMVCNTKELHQRGFRCNCCEIVKEKTSAYLSAHCLGIGWDFTVKGMTSEEARKLIKSSADILPYPCRVEGGVSWLHFDCLCQHNINEKVYEFKV